MSRIYKTERAALNIVQDGVGLPAPLTRKLIRSRNVQSQVTVAMSISNQGQAAAGQSKTRVELFMREGSGFAAAPFRSQDVPSSAVQPSAALALSAESPSVPVGFGPKSHKICVTADALRQVQENSESNNKICRQFQIPIPVVPPATP